MPLLSRRAARNSTTAVLVSIALLAIAGGCATAPALTPIANSSADAPPSAWYMDVRGMSDAPDNAGRRAYLHRRLDSAGMTATVHPFTSGALQGENLIAEVSGPATAPLVLIGAHSDRVAAGRGATDNASGSAVVLALAERLRRQPLAHHRVAVAFWDLEERGLLGASAYIGQNREKPALYINFDVFGWGDTLWMMSSDARHALVVATENAARSEGLALSAGKQYPPSDHLAFLKAGWPAVSYSLVGGGEIADTLTLLRGKKPQQMPKVMAVIHTGNDRIDYVDDAASAKGIDAVEAAIRDWDVQSK